MDVEEEMTAVVEVEMTEAEEKEVGVVAEEEMVEQGDVNLLIQQTDVTSVETKAIMPTTVHVTEAKIELERAAVIQKDQGMFQT